MKQYKFFSPSSGDQTSKIKVLAGLYLLCSSQGGSFIVFYSSWWLQAFLGSCCLTSVSTSVFTGHHFLSSTSFKNVIIKLTAHMDKSSSHLEILKIASAGILFPNKVYSQVPGVRIWFIFERTKILYTIVTISIFLIAMSFLTCNFSVVYSSPNWENSWFFLYIPIKL